VAINDATYKTGSLGIAGVIKALESNGTANSISRPKLSLYKGAKAKTLDGQSIPVRKESTTA